MLATATKATANLPSMARVVTVILGGGQGSRLYPLTKVACKPAIRYGGRYKLIDIPVSNALNSGCNNIFIITQFLSHSLHRHIFSAYRHNTMSARIGVLTAEERHTTKTWFQGTADAIRQNLGYLEDLPGDYMLILSGDQIYSMDFRPMLQFALESNADAVVAAIPVNEEETKRMGILQIDAEQFISKFKEKPQTKAELADMALSMAQKENLAPTSDKRPRYLGSMGIYLFKRHILNELLHSDSREDFGKHLLPTLMAGGKMAAFVHQGYWEDIGTIESFYHANLALTDAEPPFDCYDEQWPLLAQQEILPGARITQTTISKSLICEGSIVSAAKITHSIIGPRSRILRDTVIKDSYLIGNEKYYSTNACKPSIQYRIGENCLIQKAIIDKHVHIGNNVQLINKDKLLTYDSENVCIRDGIIVVPRGAVIPDNFIL